MSFPEILRLLYKHYGGIDKFTNLSFMNQCVLHAIEKESDIPKLINELINDFYNVRTEKLSNKKMRRAEDILSDYGLGGE